MEIKAETTRINHPVYYLVSISLQFFFIPTVWSFTVTIDYGHIIALKHVGLRSFSLVNRLQGMRRIKNSSVPVVSSHGPKTPSPPPLAPPPPPEHPSPAWRLHFKWHKYNKYTPLIESRSPAAAATAAKHNSVCFLLLSPLAALRRAVTSVGGGRGERARERERKSERSLFICGCFLGCQDKEGNTEPV